MAADLDKDGMVSESEWSTFQNTLLHLEDLNHSLDDVILNLNEEEDHDHDGDGEQDHDAEDHDEATEEEIEHEDEHHFESMVK